MEDRVRVLDERDRDKALEAELRSKIQVYQSLETSLADIEGQMSSFLRYGIINRTNHKDKNSPLYRMHFVQRNDSLDSFAESLSLDEIKRLHLQFQQAHTYYTQMYHTLLEIGERVKMAEKYLGSPEFLQQPDFVNFLKRNNHPKQEQLREGMETSEQLSKEFEQLTNEYLCPELPAYKKKAKRKTKEKAID